MDIKPKNVLKEGLQNIRPLLEKNGFKQSKITGGSSSGGHFATVGFSNGNVEIGLIVRANGYLGCPNYSAGHGYASHEKLLSVLGCDEDSSLVPGKWLSYISRTDSNPFTALFDDLSNLILPRFRKSRSEFEEAINRAHKETF